MSPLPGVLRLEYFPAALSTFDELWDRDALAVLGKAPTPAAAKALTLARIRSALRAGGRKRNIDVRARQIADGLRVAALEAPPAVVDAFGSITRSIVAVIVELNTQIAATEAALAVHFDAHPDAGIYRSMPGVGTVLGARLLGEFGDDPTATSTRRPAGTTPRPRP